ncbi:MAG: hypothetical protein JF584_19515 [Acidobacteria bacterium]|nr:hypothetical protein [Acidobacteriota bacterium]
MSSADRILVIRNRDLVPLLPEPVQAAEQPWPGVVLERHSVKPMEIPEHEHGDLCLHLQLSGDSDFEWWTEGKNRVETTAPGSMIVLPAGTRDRLRWAALTAIKRDRQAGRGDDRLAGGEFLPAMVDDRQRPA